MSEKEALKRMKEFSKRKEQFLATARTGKSSILACMVLVIFAVHAYSQSLSAGAHDFSGTYSSSWQFGGGSITLDADGTFRKDFGSCTFTTQESGTYVFSQGTLHFKILKYTGKQNADGREVDLFDPRAVREFFHYADDDKVAPPNTESVFCPVKWGERKYLIHESDLGDSRMRSILVLNLATPVHKLTIMVRSTSVKEMNKRNQVESQRSLRNIWSYCSTNQLQRQSLTFNLKQMTKRKSKSLSSIKGVWLV